MQGTMMAFIRNASRSRAGGLALMLLLCAPAASAFEALDDENLSGAGISQPDSATFAAETETAGEERPGREPGAESELIRAGRVMPPPDLGPQDRVDLTVQRG
jgi:hypothetical protein